MKLPFVVALGFALYAAQPALASTKLKTQAAKPTFKEGVYRVDWNRKVRDLCVDFFTNDDLTARDWQGVLAAQGSICEISDVKSGKTNASWVGKCEQPLAGRVGRITYRISVESHRDGSFDILTKMSGDLTATIPIRGTPLTGAASVCTKDTPAFRPWQ